MAENGVLANIAVNNASGNPDMANGHHNDNKNLPNGMEQKPQPRMNEATQKYYQELLAERTRMENHFPLALKLVDEALEKIKINGRIPNRDQYADVYQQKTIKLSQKVHVPIKDKKFNYVGKLLGPKGNSLRRLQEETNCKIVILGRFSMKDRNREEELRNSSDAKYAHLNLPLHVEVSTIAPPAEAYARIAFALAQIRRYLIPDKHDDIRQEQFRELMSDPEAAKKLTVRNQAHQNNHGGHGGHGGHNNYRGGGGGGGFRPKYPGQVQHHHGNDETVYYRGGGPNNSNYHQSKNYPPAFQRNNPMATAIIPTQAVVGGGGGPGNLIMTTANYNNRNHMINSGVNGVVPGPGVNNPNPRYRPNGSYQFTKK